MPFLKTGDAPLSVETSKGLTNGVTHRSIRSDSTLPTYIGIWNDGVSHLQGGGGAPTYRNTTILAQHATYKSYLLN